MRKRGKEGLQEIAQSKRRMGGKEEEKKVLMEQNKESHRLLWLQKPSLLSFYESRAELCVC